MESRMPDLPFDPATLRGLSAALVVGHHRQRYGAAVDRLHAVRQRLADADVATAPSLGLDGLQREQRIATHAVLLHELHLGSLVDGGQPMEPAMQLALDAGFGSVERWRDAFLACGVAQTGGSGWVLLAFRPREGTLVNQWAAEHTQAVSGAVPILALDLCERAPQADQGAAAAACVDAFLRNIDWAAVYLRYRAAVHGASATGGTDPDGLGDALVIDVRRPGVFEQAATVIPGACWRDPASVAVWARELPHDRPVVVYCVHGHEVSRAAALQLRAAGANARHLNGGIAGWQACGRPLVPKPAS